MRIPLIEFQKLTKRFNGRAVLDQADLQIYEGEVTTIIGKSGTGKSVLLKHISGCSRLTKARSWSGGSRLRR